MSVLRQDRIKPAIYPEMLTTKFALDLDGAPHWKACFDTALTFVLRNVLRCDWDLTLVHGCYELIEGSGILTDHAWVEVGNTGEIVFDGVQQKFYDREDYERVMGCEALARYSNFTAMEVAAFNDTYGPWQSRLGWTDPGPVGDAMRHFRSIGIGTRK
jgi:hypothetical protein